MPYITSQLHHETRLDITWDVYIAEKLRADTHRKRGKGVRRHVNPSSAFPGNWQAFLRIDDNKTELFSFLATNREGINTNNQVNTTYHTDVLCTNHQDVLGLTSCTHEEANSKGMHS